MLEIRNHNLEIRKALHIFCLAQPLYPLRVPRPRTAKALQPTTAVILMTAFGSIQTAVEAMRVGAFDYVQKPFDIEKMAFKIDKALEVRRRRAGGGSGPLRGHRGTTMEPPFPARGSTPRV